MAATGCPTWVDRANFDEWQPRTLQAELDRLRSAVAAPRQNLRLFLYGSDAGPDQRSLRCTLIPACLQLADSDVGFDDNCNMHQGHLAIKAQLETIDWYLVSWNCSWRYFSAIAKICHLWRDNGRAIFQLWVLKHGPVSAMKFARRLPPKPIAGRWGTLSLCEKRTLSAPASVLCDVLGDICRSSGNAPPGTHHEHQPLMPQVADLPAPIAAIAAPAPQSIVLDDIRAEACC